LGHALTNDEPAAGDGARERRAARILTVGAVAAAEPAALDDAMPTARSNEKRGMSL